MIRLLAALLFTLPLSAQSARELVEQGMDKFVAGQIAASVKDFDAAAKLSPESAPQLWQRGIARHAHDEILDMGRADLDAVADVLASREYFAGDRPSSIDATVFAFTVLAMHPPLPSPLFAHARSLPALRAYAARMIDRFVPESADVGRSLVAIDNAATPPPSSPL